MRRPHSGKTFEIIETLRMRDEQGRKKERKKRLNVRGWFQYVVFQASSEAEQVFFQSRHISPTFQLIQTSLDWSFSCMSDHRAYTSFCLCHFCTFFRVQMNTCMSVLKEAAIYSHFSFVVVIYISICKRDPQEG